MKVNANIPIRDLETSFTMLRDAVASTPAEELGANYAFLILSMIYLETICRSHKKYVEDFSRSLNAQDERYLSEFVFTCRNVASDKDALLPYRHKKDEGNLLRFIYSALRHPGVHFYGNRLVDTNDGNNIRLIIVGIQGEIDSFEDVDTPEIRNRHLSFCDNSSNVIQLRFSPELMFYDLRKSLKSTKVDRTKLELEWDNCSIDISLEEVSNYLRESE